jgi:hypothetical protein
MTMSLPGGPLRRATIRYAVEPVGSDRTEVIYTGEGELRGALRVLTPLAPAMGRATEGKNLATLKRLLETPGDFWRLLETPGDSWRLLETPGEATQEAARDQRALLQALPVKSYSHDTVRAGLTERRLWHLRGGTKNGRSPAGVHRRRHGQHDHAGR